MTFYRDDKGTLYNGDSKEIIDCLPDSSINCIVTSPPYYGLRDYQIDGQIGLEFTPKEYVDNLLEILNKLMRPLKDNGTFWLVIGDSYASKSKGSGGASKKQDSNVGSRYQPRKFNHGVKDKDLIGIPWMVAFALRDSGWYLRNEIIWHKTNAMPTSAKDRCTYSHEQIFLFSKSPKYYFDNLAIAEEAVWTAKESTKRKRGFAKKEGSTGLNPSRHGNSMSGMVIGRTQDGHRGPFNIDGTLRAKLKEGIPIRNKRDVWSIPTKGFKGSHFATYPPKLIEPCVLAGCPENGVVLDPFFGAGTTGLVAEKLNRNWIGIELNENYCQTALERIIKERQ